MRLVVAGLLMLIASLIALVVINPVHSLPLPAKTMRFSVEYDDGFDAYARQKSRLDQTLTAIGSRNGFKISGWPLSLWDPTTKRMFDGSRFGITQSHTHGVIALSEVKHGELSMLIEGERRYSGLEILLIPFSTDAQRFESMTKQLEDELTRW